MPTPQKPQAKAKKLGRNIARHRAAKEFTQEKLAEKADVSARYVQDLERGLYAPTVFIANRVRKALNITWDDLLKGC